MSVWFFMIVKRDSDLANIPRRPAADLSGPAAQLACFTVFKPQKPVQNAL
ncbi:hypothetical protein U8Q05_13255 [Rhizobium ruizarguesonis]|nr:hypothetical protein U8Q05_13255 [Rhizobium ruizarguesonis]